MKDLNLRILIVYKCIQLLERKGDNVDVNGPSINQEHWREGVLEKVQKKDPTYASFLINTVDWVLADVWSNILNHQPLFDREQPEEWRVAEQRWYEWIKPTREILQRLEQWKDEQKERKKKDLIINTHGALYGVLKLAGRNPQTGANPPTEWEVKANQDYWWRRVFQIECVERRNHQAEEAEMETDDEDDLFEGLYIADLDAGPQEPLWDPDRDFAIDKSFKPLSLVEGSWVWAIDPNRGGNFIYAIAT
ncbi:hypothetical protein HK102_000570 [Quaeritorhiza haematococci]|nr:hypothetical protein HK102_000570 [Quaeritorhiza haematococci]